jgi:hypothetical protein
MDRRTMKAISSDAMPKRDRTSPKTTRAEVDARIGKSFLALNQIAASLALIERSCGRVLEGLPVGDDAALDNAMALRVASLYAHVTLEQIGDVSDTLTTVLRFLGQEKARAPRECRALAGVCEERP